MRRIAVLVCGIACLGLPAATAGAATITNGTVSLGVNPEGDLNAQDAASGALICVTYNATGNDGTRQGLPAEGWGAGASGPSPIVATPTGTPAPGDSGRS